MIVDASIAIKWIKEEEDYRDKANELLRRHLSKEEIISVPSLFFIEFANSLVTKSATLSKTIRKHLKFIYSKDFTIYQPEERDLLNTSLLAKKYKTTVYDMLYAVVAKKYKTVLITADEQFIKKTKFSFVKHISQI